MSDYGTTPAAKTPAMIAAAAIACALGLGGILAAMFLAFSGPSTSHHAAAPRPQQTSSPANTNGHNVQPANHPHTNSPENALPNQELPAAQVETIQRELGQLNYYEGPVNGVMNGQTVEAIKYLQRDADLPQNGYYDQVTYLALQRMLTTGNNQMGGAS